MDWSKTLVTVNIFLPLLAIGVAGWNKKSDPQPQKKFRSNLLLKINFIMAISFQALLYATTPIKMTLYLWSAGHPQEAVHGEDYPAAYYFKVVSTASSREVPVNPQETGNHPPPFAIPSTQDFHLAEELATKITLSPKDTEFINWFPKWCPTEMVIKHLLPLKLMVHWSSKVVLGSHMLKT